MDTSVTLDSQFVRDQLQVRVGLANEKRIQPEGEYVLYWMQACDRFSDNWALRYATLEADRLNRPLIIHHGLGPSDPLANDRSHTFILQGAAELAQQAKTLGYYYQFWLRRTTQEQGGAIDTLARRACLVVTDDLPTAGVNARTARFAERAPCRVVRVESWCIVPAGTFGKEEYAARTIRPKLAKLRDHCLTPVIDHPPRKDVSPALARSLGGECLVSPKHANSKDTGSWQTPSALETGLLDMDALDIAREVARCDIDHTVGAAMIVGGYTIARERLDEFITDGFSHYETRRNEPADSNGSSRLSPFLHYGHISAAEVARTVLAHGSRTAADAFLDQMVTWRELGFNFCSRNRHFDKLRALPNWVVQTMQKHVNDPRDVVYSLAALESASTYDALWNAGQRELVQTGIMHNVVRMLWGKSVLLWSNTYGTALRNLLYLNNRYSLDGFDPNSYAGILWCFGKFDRPFAERPVWGTIRSMSLERARKKFDADAYIKQWS